MLNPSFTPPPPRPGHWVVIGIWGNCFSATHWYSFTLYMVFQFQHYLSLSLGSPGPAAVPLWNTLVSSQDVKLQTSGGATQSSLLLLTILWGSAMPRLSQYSPLPNTCHGIMTLKYLWLFNECIHDADFQIALPRGRVLEKRAHFILFKQYHCRTLSQSSK